MAKIIFPKSYRQQHALICNEIARLQQQQCFRLLEILGIEGLEELMDRMDKGQRYVLSVPDRSMRNQLNGLLGAYPNVRFAVNGGELFRVRPVREAG
jgi:hypothetical protein